MRLGGRNLVSYVSQMAAKKGNSKQRYVGITSYLEAAGAYKVPKSVKEELAKRFEVTVRQIELDINKLLEKVIRPKLKRISGQFTLTLNSNLDDSHDLKRSQDPLIKARGIGVANQTINTYTDFLEKFGFKEPIAQRHQVEGMSTTFNIIEKSVEEIKDAKSRGLNSKSKADGNDKSS